MDKIWKLLLFLLLTLFIGKGALSAIITGGSLMVEVGDDHGSLHGLQFHGNEYFRHGNYVADFVLQEGDDTLSAMRNTPEHGSNPFVTFSEITFTTLGIDHGALTTRGLYDRGSEPIEITRTYSLIPDVNRLEITTALRHLGTRNIEDLRFLESFDPDPGENFHHLTEIHFPAHETVNDVRRTGGFDVAVAYEDYDLPNAGTMIHGMENNGVTMANADLALALTAFGTEGTVVGFHESLRPSVNEALGGLIDPDGVTDDLSMNVGVVFADLAPGEIARVKVALGFGRHVDEAVAALGVPVPGGLVLLATAVGGLSLLSRQRQRSSHNSCPAFY